MEMMVLLSNKRINPVCFTHYFLHVVTWRHRAHGGAADPIQVDLTQLKN